MDDEKVSFLNAVRAIKADDNRLWTPTDCLRDCIADIRKGLPVEKLVVIRLNTSDTVFNVGYSSANIRASEIIAAIECLKVQLLIEMGYNFP